MDLILIYLAWAYVLWLLFLIAMIVKQKHTEGTLSKGVLLLTVPALFAALVTDVAFNLVSSILFLELPKEWTFSERVSRYCHGSDWRMPIGKFICRTLLDPFDTGGHCK